VKSVKSVTYHLAHRKFYLVSCPSFTELLILMGRKDKEVDMGNENKYSVWQDGRSLTSLTSLTKPTKGG
jgi:hypothetical protein